MWRPLLIMGVIVMLSFTSIQAAAPCKDCDAPTDLTQATDFKSYSQIFFTGQNADNGQPIKSSVNIILPGEQIGDVRTDVKIVTDVNLIFPARISLTLDDQPCEPASITLPLVALRYESFFNCSVSTEGAHIFQLDTNALITNNLGTYTTSYFTQDRATVSLKGTDYIGGDIGKIHLQLLQGNTYLNNRSCRTDAFYPNNSFFLTHVPMININTSQGVYYYDFVVPQITGVYPVTAECRISVNGETMLATNFFIQNGTDTAGTFFDTHAVDGATHDTQESTANPRTYLSFYNFTPSTTINLSELFQIDVSGYYSLHESGAVTVASSENFQLMLKNYSSGQCVFLANITGRAAANSGSVLGTISTGNLSTFFSPNSQIITVCINDANKTDTNRDRLNLDFLSVNVDTSPFVPVQSVRGSNELNVLSWVAPLFGNITAINSTQSFACFINETSIAESVWGFRNYTGNRTLNPALNVSPTIVFTPVINITVNQTTVNITNTTVIVNVTTETVNPIVFFNGTVNSTLNFTFSPNIVVNATFNVTANFSLSDFSSAVNTTVSNLLFGYCPEGRIGKCVYMYFVRALAIRPGSSMFT